METLNQKIFDIAYAHFAETATRIFINIAGKVAVHNPVMRAYVQPINKDFEVLTLNISPSACQLHSLAEGLYVSARFGGRLAEETFPWDTVKVLYNPEASDQRVLLPDVILDGATAEVPAVPETTPVKKVNPFKVVEGGKE